MLAAWLLIACAASMGVALPRSQRASTACQNYHHEGYNNGNETHTVRSGNYTRNYTVSVPTGYNDSPRRKWPVIIDFHGNNGTPDQQYNNSRFFDYTAGQQYLVVYPQGVEAHWQGPTYAVKGVDDLQFVTDLTSKIKAEYCVDHDRVYASGKSNGGGFVDLLACSHHGDEFAAFAVAAGALYSSTNSTSCSKKRAMLESHGVADKVIPYAGGVGSGGPLPDVSQWVSWWGQRTCGSNATASDSRNMGGYNTTSYSCGNYTEAIKHYRVFELGHCWPSGTSNNYDASDVFNQTDRKCLDKALDFTPVVLDFFSKWTLPNAPRN
ncbi:putative feruloyl esterase [Sphaerulina musiva]